MACGKAKKIHKDDLRSKIIWWVTVNLITVRSKSLPCIRQLTVVAFFCHFGVTSVLLSHLFHVSPMILLHSMIAVPSAVTKVVTEERRQGTASFRMLSFGEVSHLTAAGITPSVSGRFCETYESHIKRGDRID